MSLRTQSALRVRGHEPDVGSDGAHHHPASTRRARAVVALQTQAPGTSRPHSEKGAGLLSEPYPRNPVPPEKAQTARGTLTKSTQRRQRRRKNNKRQLERAKLALVVFAPTLSSLGGLCQGAPGCLRFFRRDRVSGVRFR